MSVKHWYRRIALGCLLSAALIPVGGCFESPEELCQMGRAAYEKGEFDKAFKYYRQSADKDCAGAKKGLGDIYYTGQGAEKDVNAALDWYKKAAEQNNAEAQLRLGEMYLNGEGVDKNAEAAFKWYKKAAEQNIAEAWLRLGDLYRTGGGVGKDAAAALDWYKKAAGQNNAEAQFNIGCMYLSGEGVAKNGAEALKWLEKAGNGGSEPAMFKLGDMYYDGIGVKADKSKGFAWYKKCAQQGSAKAAYTVGLLYYKGSGVAKDKQSAVKWFEKSAEGGFAQAQYDLGCMYLEGDGVNKDEAKGRQLLEKACAQNHAGAMYRLGTCYAEGLGCQKDRSAAVKWIKKAADAGSSEADAWIADRKGRYEDVSDLGIPYCPEYGDMSMGALHFGDSLSTLEQHYPEACQNVIRLETDPQFREYAGMEWFRVKRSGRTTKAEYVCDTVSAEYTLFDDRVVKADYSEAVTNGRLTDSERTKLLQECLAKLRRAVIDGGYGTPSVDTPLRCEWHTDGVHISMFPDAIVCIKLEMKVDGLQTLRKPKISGWEDLL